MLRALPNTHFLKDLVTTTSGAHVRSFSVLGAYSLPKILRKLETLAISCFGSVVLRARGVFDMCNYFGDGTFPLGLFCIVLGEPCSGTPAFVFSGRNDIEQKRTV